MECPEMAGENHNFMGNPGRSDGIYSHYDPILYCPVPAWAGGSRFFPGHNRISYSLVSVPRPGKSRRYVYGRASGRQYYYLADLRLAFRGQLARSGRMALGFYFRRNPGRDFRYCDDFLSDRPAKRRKM